MGTRYDLEIGMQMVAPVTFEERRVYMGKGKPKVNRWDTKV